MCMFFLGLWVSINDVWEIVLWNASVEITPESAPKAIKEVFECINPISIQFEQTIKNQGFYNEGNKT